MENLAPIFEVMFLLEAAFADLRYLVDDMIEDLDWWTRECGRHAAESSTPKYLQADLKLVSKTGRTVEIVRYDTSSRTALTSW
jgi:hypothetical protein